MYPHQNHLQFPQHPILENPLKVSRQGVFDRVALSQERNPLRLVHLQETPLNRQVRLQPI